MGLDGALRTVGGGSGADVSTILGLALGVVGAVPTVTSLFRRLRRDVPDCPQREEAWDTATWAVSLQYDSVERRALRLHSETRHPDHWSFSMFLPESRDEFEVDVFGSRSNVVATRVRWTNGDPWNRAPSLDDP